LNRRQVRWSLFLSDFNYQLIYRPGREGEKPDALSRRSDYQLKNSDDQMKNQFQTLISKDKFLLAATQQQSRELNLLENLKMAQHKENDLELLKNKYHCCIVDDLVMFQDRIYVPKTKRLEILNLCHDNRLAGHPGNRKTFQLLAKTYWWPSIRRLQILCGILPSLLQIKNSSRKANWTLTTLANSSKTLAFDFYGYHYRSPNSEFV